MNPLTYSQALVPVMQNFKFEHVADFLDEFELVFKGGKKGVARHIAVYERQIKV